MGMAAYGDPHRFDLSNLFSFSPQAQQLRMQTQLINNSSTSCFESHCNFDFISSIVGIPHVPSSGADWQQVHYDLAASVQDTFTAAYLTLSNILSLKLALRIFAYLAVVLLTVLRICLYSVIPI